MSYDRDIMEPSTIVLCSSLASVPLVGSLRNRFLGTGTAEKRGASEHSGGPKNELGPTPRTASGDRSGGPEASAEPDGVPASLIRFLAGLRPRWDGDRTTFTLPFRG